ncbi:hypothetical protein PSHT_10344, partial [Puccinia striiformis]
MPPKKLSQLKEVCVCATQGCSRFNYVEDGITWPGVQLTLNVVKSHRLANERAKTSHRNVDSTPMVNRFHGLSVESNQLIATQQLGSSNTSLPPDSLMNDKNRRIEIHALKKQIVFERLILREEGKSEEEIENSLKDLQSQLSALTHQPTPHTKIEMAKSPEEALAELRQEMIRVNAKMAMLEATTAAPPQQVPQPVPNATQAAVLANFIKLQTNFHKEGNAWKIVLNNHGSNYKQWEASIDQTPMHAFCVTTTFVNNKDCLSSLTSQQEASICGLLKHTICDSHDKNVEAGGMEKPNEVFNYLKTKCSHSDRRSKIELASTLLQLANDTSPSDDFTVSKWSKNLSALTKLQTYLQTSILIFDLETVAPNHYMAIHLAECLKKFGPVRSWWAFPLERLMAQILKASHNNHIGELEITFLNDFCWLGNLRFLLNSDRLPDQLRPFIAPLRTCSDPVPRCIPQSVDPHWQKQILSSEIFPQLITKIDSIKSCTDQLEKIAHVNRRVKFLQSVHVEPNLTYASYAVSHNNLMIQFRVTSSRVETCFGRINQIFKHKRVILEKQTLTNVWLVVCSQFCHIPPNIPHPFTSLVTYNLQVDLCYLETHKPQVIHIDEAIAHCAWIHYQAKEISTAFDQDCIALVSLDQLGSHYQFQHNYRFGSDHEFQWLRSTRLI